MHPVSTARRAANALRRRKTQLRPWIMNHVTRRLAYFCRVPRLFRYLILCTLALVLAPSIIMYDWFFPKDVYRVRDGRSLTVPYRSSVDVYARHAIYTAPLPDGAEDANLATNEKPEVSKKVRLRMTRQRALEDELNAYLRAEGIKHDRPIRIRFLIISNFIDWKLCTAVGAASLAGFSIPIAGFNAAYTHISRFKTYLDFVRREGLRDEDIVVTVDSDVFWTGADFMPFLMKFARFSPAKEADLDVAAVRAWEDFGEKKAPLFMEQLQRKDPRHAKRPSMQLPPVMYSTDEQCWWGQHSEGFVRCHVAFATLEHLIEKARNGRSSYNMTNMGGFTRQCPAKVREDMEKSFVGKDAWMVADVFGEPNAFSPYATQPVLAPEDAFFYHPSSVNRANPTSLLNGGMHVARVWGLRYLAQALDAYVKMEKPVMEAYDAKTKKWWCDQSVFRQIYVRARLFEIEHRLLEGPPLSQRSPALPHDPRFGPPGLFGLDRRSEMAVLALSMELYPQYFHEGGYLERQFPESTRFWVRNRTQFLIGENWPKGEDMDDLGLTRGGALVTPPLLWRSATLEDRFRGFENVREVDADTVHVPFIHYAAPTKLRRFSEHRLHYAWLVAARHDRRSREAASNTLMNEAVELWLNDRRIYVNYLDICEDPTMLAGNE